MVPLYTVCPARAFTWPPNIEVKQIQRINKSGDKTNAWRDLQPGLDDVGRGDEGGGGAARHGRR